MKKTEVLELVTGIRTGMVVIFTPASDDKILQAQLNRVKVDSLSAKVIVIHDEEGTVNLIVSIPDRQNVLVENVSLKSMAEEGEACFELPPVKGSPALTAGEEKKERKTRAPRKSKDLLTDVDKGGKGEGADKGPKADAEA